MARTMSEATKARLKALVERRKAADPLKGRKTLRGLDPYGWSAALDEVLNGGVKLPDAFADNLAADGSVRASHNWLAEVVQAQNSRAPAWSEFWLSEETYDSVAFHEAMREYQKTRDYVTHVRVNRATAIQLADLTRAFPPRFLALPTFSAEIFQKVSGKVPVFPVAAVLTVFAAVWSEPTSFRGSGEEATPIAWRWSEMGAKYLTGYTRAAVEELEWTDYTPPRCSD